MNDKSAARDDDINRSTPEWAGRLLTLKETGAITGDSRSTIYRRFEAGDYQKIKIGGSTRIPGWSLWRRIRGET